MRGATKLWTTRDGHLLGGIAFFDRIDRMIRIFFFDRMVRIKFSEDRGASLHMPCLVRSFLQRQRLSRAAHSETELPVSDRIYRVVRISSLMTG